MTLRPHPNTVKLAGVVLEKIHRKHGKNSNFHFESNVAGCDALLRSQVMVSDWSGAALEYAFGLGKPVVFIDVPRKVNNPDYATLELEPIEVSIREKIGVVVDPEQLDTLPKVLFGVIETGLDHSDFFNLRDKLVFNIGKQDEVGARYLIGLLD